MKKGPAEPGLFVLDWQNGLTGPASGGRGGRSFWRRRAWGRRSARAV